MPRVMIPPPYRGPTRGKAELSVAGATIRECLNAIEAECPGFAAQVFDGSGRLHRFVKLFRNGEPVEKDAFDTPIAEGDEISVVAAIAGGSV